MNDQDNKSSAVEVDTPPWLQAVPEDQVEVSGGLGGKTMAALAVGSVLLVGLFAAVIFVLYEEDNSPPPHFAAPDNPVRVAPENRGGMNVPDQDKAIYERGAGVEVDPNASLDQPAEQPVSEIPEQATAPTESNTQPAYETEPEPETVTPDPVPTQATPRRDTTAAQTDTSSPTEPALSPAEAAEIYRVQLGAFGSTESAGRAWDRLKAKFRSDLGALQPSYEAVETSDRTLYRLRVGPIYNRADADALCLALKAQDQACLVVRP